MIGSSMAVACQIGVASIGLVAAAVAPPSNGPLLLVALTARAETRLVPIARDGGAALIGRGPLNGSLVVRGERAVLAGPLLRNGILLLAAPAVACGAPAVDGEDR